ncbi:MAG TPA: hypothetical protein VLB80_00645 [Candidatus Babeliales bacterium]|nr:hypothetical protein [Candidatus Babeliales bacterium]
MDNNEIVFLLNHKEKIRLTFQGLLHEIDCCDDGLITFIQDYYKIILNDGSIRDAIYILGILLQKSLNKKLLLPESIKEDIGFVYNQYNYSLWLKDDFIITNPFLDKNVEENNVWIGTIYHLWAFKECVTWLYNDKNGLIIFEITPLYPFFYDTPKELSSISYNEWIKNYKPYVIKVIPKEIAQQWLQQANALIKQIDANIVRD